MSQISDTFESVCNANGIAFLQALKSIQALTQNKNKTWPIGYLDTPKDRVPELNLQGAIENEWNLFFTILDRDKKTNGEIQSQAIVDNCRTIMDTFIQGLRDEADANGRKVVREITGLKETEIRQWSAGVLSGVAMEITLKFMDPTYACT